MERSQQSQIAEKLGIRPSYLNDIIKRRRSCSKKMAKRLEDVTGIDRRAWQYPDEFPNPFISQDEQDTSEASNGN